MIRVHRKWTLENPLCTDAMGNYKMNLKITQVPGKLAGLDVNIFDETKQQKAAETWSHPICHSSGDLDREIYDVLGPSTYSTRCLSVGFQSPHKSFFRMSGETLCEYAKRTFSFPLGGNAPTSTVTDLTF